MLTTTHLLVGVAIGKHFHNPFLIIVFAFISHYILDFIPHYSLKTVTGFKENGLWGANKKELIKKGVEPLVGIFLTILFILINKEYKFFIILGALVSLFPDFLQFIGWKYDFYLLRKYIPRPENKLYRISKSMWWIIIQIIIVTLSIIVILL